MRIQPHVWASPDPGDEETFLPDVIRISICTHSHPTGIVGAVFHALVLARAMATHRFPLPDDLLACVAVAERVPEIMSADHELGSKWLEEFERECGSFDAKWARAVSRTELAVRAAAESTPVDDPAARFERIISCLDLRDRAWAGSGILTAAAAVLIWCAPEPYRARRLAANTYWTDTDSIATMAGAILGVTAESGPPVEVLDADLLRSEAERLAEILLGKRPPGHRYPDLSQWYAPLERGDAIVRSPDGGLRVRGFGTAKAKGEVFSGRATRLRLQWVELEGKQSLLVKLP